MRLIQKLIGCDRICHRCLLTFSQKGKNIMNTAQNIPQPMTEEQLEKIKDQIIQTYLYLVSRTGYDPNIIEIMKLSALADVQRRYEAGETW